MGKIEGVNAAVEITKVIDVFSYKKRRSVWVLSQRWSSVLMYSRLPC